MLDKFFNIHNERANFAQLLIFMAIAFTFSLMFRQVYLAEVSRFMDISYHGSYYIINNNDGFYFAEGARDILAGFHQPNDLSPVDYPLSKLTAFLAKIFHIDLNTLIFYLPGVLGSLLVVPLILLGYELGSVFLGFLAALLAPIVWSYYHRTMYGYYDTDMLVIVLPLFAIWGVVRALIRKSFLSYWVAPLFLIVAIVWHSGLYQVANGIFVMALLYVLIFDRDKRNFLYLALLLVALLHLPLLIKIALLFILNFLFFKFETALESHMRYFLIGVVGVYTVFGASEWIASIVHSGYFTRSSITQEAGLKFFSVINTVREAGHISFDTLVHRISGSYLGFFVGALGYLLLLIRYPVMMVSLPMVVLGLYAMWGGLRFTIFAVPFFALGDAFVVLLIAKQIEKIFLNEKWGRVAYYLFSLLAILGFIYPNFTHAQKYIMPPVFNAHEIDILQKFKKIAKRDDYVLTWWDYGYPIRYYADVKTLVDGGKHSGDVNFPVSFALSTTSQRASYNMAVLDVYFTEKFYKDHNNSTAYVEAMMKHYGFSDPDEFLQFLQEPIDLPKVKEDIYYYLPLRMLDIFPTVARFSQVDLKTGKVEQEHFFYQSRNFTKRGDILYLGRGIELLLKRAALKVGNRELPLSRYTTILFDKNGKSEVKTQLITPMAMINIIHLPQMRRILVVDNSFYDSVYFQLYLFDNYDKELFEPVIIDPFVKIYRLKK